MSLWEIDGRLIENDAGTALLECDTCPCDGDCCTECTLTETLTATPDPGGNGSCFFQGATLTDRTLTCMNTERGGEWPVPAGTNYWYGDCLSDITSYDLVVYCVDGQPVAFIWDDSSETIEGTYALLSSQCDPIEWQFETVEAIACADCATNLLIVE